MVIKEKKKVNDEATCAARNTTSANKVASHVGHTCTHPSIFFTVDVNFYTLKIINIIVAEFIQLQIQTVTYDPLVKAHQEQYKAHT